MMRQNKQSFMTPSIVWDRRHAALCTRVAGTGKAQSYYIRSDNVFAVRALVHGDSMPQGFNSDSNTFRGISQSSLTRKMEPCGVWVLRATSSASLRSSSCTRTRTHQSPIGLLKHCTFAV